MQTVMSYARFEEIRQKVDQWAMANGGHRPASVALMDLGKDGILPDPWHCMQSQVTRLLVELGMDAVELCEWAEYHYWNVFSLEDT